MIKRKLDGQRQISQLDQTIEQINSELAGLRSEKAQLAAKLTDVRVNNENQLLRSPVEGIAFDVKLTNPAMYPKTNQHKLLSKSYHLKN